MRRASFGEKVLKARERQKLTRATLALALHAGRCDKQHPEPYTKGDWLDACQKSVDRIWDKTGAIEKGRASDPELEAQLSQILGMDSRKEAAPSAANQGL